jgi:hypothetical protein
MDGSDDWLFEAQAPVVLPFSRAAPSRSSAQILAGFPEGSAAEMLLSGDGRLAQNLLFFQLPPDLPTSGAIGLAPAPSKDDQAHPREFGNRCKELGSGSLGKLQLHKSGRATIRLGHVLYEVCAGTECACAQEVVALSADNCANIGDVRARMLCVPSIEALTAGLAGRPDRPTHAVGYAQGAGGGAGSSGAAGSGRGRGPGGAS